MPFATNFERSNEEVDKDCPKPSRVANHGWLVYLTDILSQLSLIRCLWTKENIGWELCVGFEELRNQRDLRAYPDANRFVTYMLYLRENTHLPCAMTALV